MNLQNAFDCVKWSLQYRMASISHLDITILGLMIMVALMHFMVLQPSQHQLTQVEAQQQASALSAPPRPLPAPATNDTHYHAFRKNLPLASQADTEWPLISAMASDLSLSVARMDQKITKLPDNHVISLDMQLQASGRYVDLHRFASRILVTRPHASIQSLQLTRHDTTDTFKMDMTVTAYLATGDAP